MFRPRIFYTTSRTEPARTILFVIGSLTFMGQLAATLIFPSLAVALNGLLVMGLAGYATWSAEKNSIKHMPMGSFWLFVMWLYSGLTRALVSPDPTQLLWFPMLVVAGVLSVVYIYLSGQKKVGRNV